jgi:hypothetical protein
VSTKTQFGGTPAKSAGAPVRSRRIAFLLLLAASLPQLFGQATSGSITGLVTDPSGASVGGSKVTITEVNKGISFNVTTNDLGYYTFARVPAGSYTAKVEKAGFKTFIRENLQLLVDSTVRLDVNLQLGATAEEVVVTAAAPIIKSERADVSTAIDNRLITEVPTIGRNVAYLQLLAPGAILEAGQTGLAENPQGSLAITSNGQPNGARNMQLDGVDNNENVLGGNVVIPTQESVQDFKVTTSSWDAEFGRAGGAVTQIETKSGSNGLHGSAFEYLRNTLTNARNSFTQPSGPPPFKWNQFGGSLGGPIRKNKTFFFGDYQGQRQRLGNSVFATVPTLAMRRGDFSQLRDSQGNLIPIFDPLTGDANGNGRQAFQNNQIPANRVSAVATNLFNLLPTPTYPNNIENNYIAAGSTSFTTNQESVRIDHYLDQNTRLFGRYMYFGSSLFSPPIYGVQAGGPALQGGVGGNSSGRNENLSLNLTHIFKPTLLMDARYGYSHYRVQVLQADANTDLSTKVGIPNINQGDVNTSGLSQISVSGIGAFNMGGAAACNCPLNEVMNQQQGAVNLTWIRGSHTVKFGADVRHYANLRVTNAARRGTFSFTPGITGSAAVANSGFATASLLLGAVTSFSQQFNYQDNIGNEFETHVFGYAQDSWKITPKLTLNYGLRWEMYTPPATPTGAGSNLDISTGMVLIAGVGNVSNRVNVTTRKANFAPRLGLSYLLGEKTVVRAGVARSYFPNVYNILISGNYPLIGTQSILNATSYSPAMGIADQRPAFTFPTIPSSGEFPLPANVGITFNPFDRFNAYVDAWNFTIQRQLASTLSLEVGYVGNELHHGYWNVPLNRAFPGPGALAPRRPLYQKFGWTQNVTARGNWGDSNYNSLQVHVEKRVSQGFAFIASYAWSKFINSGTYDVVSDPWNWRIDRGLADQDRASVFSIGHVYELPFGPGKRFLPNVTGVARHFVGGWMFTGLTSMESGLPFSPRLANTTTFNSDISTLRPDEVGNPGLPNASRNLWFDPQAFAVPALYHWGTAGRNILRGPSLHEFDLSLDKVFQITERTHLEFRADAINAFNYTNLANPTATVDSPTAGQIFGLIGNATMRQMQFGLRLSW